MPNKQVLCILPLDVAHLYSPFALSKSWSVVPMPKLKNTELPSMGDSIVILKVFSIDSLHPIPIKDFNRISRVFAQKKDANFD